MTEHQTTNKKIDMRKISIILIVVTFLSSCYYDKEEELYGNDCDTTSVTYANKTEKIIAESCATAGCHVAGTGRHIYDSYTSVKADVDNGTILAKVINDKTMPPGTKLSDCDFETIKAWLDQGAIE